MLKTLKKLFLGKKTKKMVGKEMLIIEKASKQTLGDEGSWKEGKHGKRTWK